MMNWGFLYRYADTRQHSQHVWDWYFYKLTGAKPNKQEELK